MKKYKIKRFSLWEKTKAGLKGFGKGALAGGFVGGGLGTIGAKCTAETDKQGGKIILDRKSVV